jgi:hypothetical protein
VNIEALVPTAGRADADGLRAADADELARGVLESAGFRWIDEALWAILVTGLCVYHFGDREPLKVSTLLFYWQD